MTEFANTTNAVETAKTGRLVVVSNRLPVTVTENEGQLTYSSSSGGLASGLGAYLEKEAEKGNNADYIWIGWPGNSYSDEIEPEITQKLRKDYNASPVFLSDEQMEGFYYGYSNSTLWPLFHYFTSYAHFDESMWQSYVEVNRLFAEETLKIATEDDTIWVHDYQLMLVPQMLREKLPKANIGFFLHIPFPSHDIFRIIPRTQGIALMEGVLGADVIGFHTYDYTHHFLRSVLRILGHSHNMGTIGLNDRSVHVDTFPMGIEYGKFADMAVTDEVAEHIRGFEKVMDGRKCVISVDRLDYTKGILNRLTGFEFFLEQNPEWQEKVKLILIVVPSRESVESYDQMKHQIDEAVGRINGRFGMLSWTPVVYNYRSVSFPELVAGYTLSHAALITPLRDGMNLVAKEYVACRKDTDGVLILSEMAGAAAELNEAILINPYSKEDIADGIKNALEMSITEQRNRMTAMQERIRRYDVVRWAQDFMGRLKKHSESENIHELRYVSGEIRREICEAFHNAKRRVIFLDYDGTLVGFHKDPLEAKPDARVLNLLCRLSNMPNMDVVVVSGRHPEDLEGWMGSCNITLVAEHGACIRRKGEGWHSVTIQQEGWKDMLRPILETYVDRLPGSFVEDKKFCLVWHYRNTDPELGPLRAQELIDSLQTFTGNMSSVQVLPGNKVVELRDPNHNKGSIAAQISAEMQPDFVLAFGDDVTDEDLFKSLGEEAYSIKVGKQSTAAKFRVKWHGEVLDILEALADCAPVPVSLKES